VQEIHVQRYAFAVRKRASLGGSGEDKLAALSNGTVKVVGGIGKKKGAG